MSQPILDNLSILEEVVGSESLVLTTFKVHIAGAYGNAELILKQSRIGIAVNSVRQLARMLGKASISTGSFTVTTTSNIIVSTAIRDILVKMLRYGNEKLILTVKRE